MRISQAYVSLGKLSNVASNACSNKELLPRPECAAQLCDMAGSSNMRKDQKICCGKQGEEVRSCL